MTTHTSASDVDTDEEAFIAAVDRFLEGEVQPHVHKWEHEDHYPHEVVAQMKEMGLFGCTIKSEYGGLGLPTRTYARIMERMSRTWMSLAGIVNSHLIMAMAVQNNGTEEQRRRFLPRFASGELRGGVGLTEPDCGTDLQAIRTIARRDGGDYVVNGSKTWITNSLHGNCIALLVKTDVHAEPRHRGMSLLIAEKGPGFQVVRQLEKLGYKGIDTCELLFEDYRVSADCLGAWAAEGFQRGLRVETCASGAISTLCGESRGAVERLAVVKASFTAR